MTLGTIYDENKELMVLTKNEDMWQVYRVVKNANESTIDLMPVVLAQTTNVVAVKDYHFSFHFNKFTNCKQGDKSIAVKLDKIVMEQLWSVIETILYPIVEIKKLIYE